MRADGAQAPEPISGARLLFSLDPATAYLNHGSFGAVPIGVQRAQQRLREEADANPMRYFTRGLVDRVSHVRGHLATFLGAEPGSAALVTNTTTGVAVVLNSVELSAGDEILLTSHGYGAVHLAAESLASRTGAILRTASVPMTATDDEIISALLGAARRDRTRLAIIDQVTSPTVCLFPVRAAVEALHEIDVPVLVDGAHVPGMLPVQVAALGADFWVGNFHKWGLAPAGTAMLCVAPGWRDRIRPLIVSWDHGSGFPLSVESQGYRDLSQWLAAPVGLYTLRTLGLDKVRAHNAALAAYGQHVVGGALGYGPAELPEPGGPDISMRVVPLPAGIAADTADAVALRMAIADRLATEVAINAWHGQGLLRLSAQVYNRAEEYDRLAEGLPALLAGHG